MQEEQTVAFQPMYEGYRAPWFTTLFVVYLLAALTVMMIRAIGLALNMRRLKQLEKSDASLASAFYEVWNESIEKACSFKRISIVTSLLAVADLTFALIDILRGILTQKSTQLIGIAGRTADALAPFALAILICTALYICGSFFDGRLVRRKLKFDLHEDVRDHEVTHTSR